MTQGGAIYYPGHCTDASVTRAEYRAVAQERLADAQALFSAGRFAGAYYLAGYAIECALKACITRQFMRHDIPDRELVRRIYVHDLTALVRLAPGLDQALRQERASDQQFEVFWTEVLRWSESTRYLATNTRGNAADLITAITDRQHGVLRWLRRHW
jgi:hypothetical protein